MTLLISTISLVSGLVATKSSIKRENEVLLSVSLYFVGFGAVGKCKYVVDRIYLYGAYIKYTNMTYKEISS